MAVEAPSRPPLADAGAGVVPKSPPAAGVADVAVEPNKPPAAGALVVVVAEPKRPPANGAVVAAGAVAPKRPPVGAVVVFWPKRPADAGGCCEVDWPKIDAPATLAPRPPVAAPEP